jgi:bifunctional DNA-binding transcriptional regulator/antitoxin component of YhaV-PrlF toxin-antitoxin module
MVYAGSHEMRTEEAKDVSDGINGTISLAQNITQAINAKGDSIIQVLVEFGGQSLVIERSLHSNGKSFTIPSSARKELGLSPGDEVEIWVDLLEREPKKSESKPKSKSKRRQTQKTLTGDDAEMQELSVWFVGDADYHYVDDEDADETNCGISLEGRDYRGPTTDPGEFLTVCPDCNVRSSKSMTNEEIVDWLADTMGFERTGGPPSYLNKEQLVVIRDYILELQDRVDGEVDTEDGSDEVDEEVDAEEELADEDEDTGTDAFADVMDQSPPEQ